MLLKKLAIFVVAFVMVIALGMIQGCSDSDKILEPVLTGNDEGSEDFIQDLSNGEYQFALDEDDNLLPLDGNAIPKVEQSLYEQFLLESEIPEQKVRTNAIAASTTTSYWRYAIYREICFALSRTKYLAGSWGASTRVYYRSGYWFAGDWDYCGYGYGSGGPSCKEFARTIVTRATGGRYYLPSGYNYATGSISWCYPGDVIQRSDYWGTPHTAIVFKVLRRDNYGRATVIDVIDNNFITSRLIARHVLPLWGYELYQFKVW